MTVAYFSLLEHLLVLVLPATDFDPSAEPVTGFIQHELAGSRRLISRIADGVRALRAIGSSPALTADRERQVTALFDLRPSPVPSREVYARSTQVHRRSLRGQRKPTRHHGLAGAGSSWPTATFRGPCAGQADVACCSGTVARYRGPPTSGRPVKPRSSCRTRGERRVTCCRAVFHSAASSKSPVTSGSPEEAGTAAMY